MKTAIFPGTFDPFHSGHEHVIKEGLKLFEKVYVLITQSDHKNPDSIEKRAETTKLKLKKYENVEIIYFNPTRLTADVIKELGCSAIIRGIRNAKDLPYELDMKNAYEKLLPNVSYVTFLTNQENKNISSSLIKEIRNNGGKI